MSTKAQHVGVCSLTVRLWLRQVLYVSPLCLNDRILELLFRPSELCAGMSSGPKLRQTPLIRPLHGNPQSLPHLSALRSPKHQSETESQTLSLFDKVNNAVSAGYRRMLLISGERETKERYARESAAMA